MYTRKEKYFFPKTSVLKAFAIRKVFYWTTSTTTTIFQNKW